MHHIIVKRFVLLLAVLMIINIFVFALLTTP